MRPFQSAVDPPQVIAGEAVLRAAGILEAEDLSSEVDRTFRAMDRDGKGAVNLDEFQKYFQSLALQA